jgi:hypothetical protein
MSSHNIIIGVSFSFQELYGDCDKLRGTVFKLATETEDNDSSLGNQHAILLAEIVKSLPLVILIGWMRLHCDL